MAAASGLLILLLLLASVVAGAILIILSRKRGNGYPACGQCGYDVSGTLGTVNARCPECGGEFALVGITPATTRTNRSGMWVGLALIAVPLVCVGGMVFTMYTGLVRAREAARAAAVQQMAAMQQQASIAAIQKNQAYLQQILASQPADPVLVATFAPAAAAMSEGDATQRMFDIAEQWAEQTHDPDTSARLLAEYQALLDRRGVSPPMASQP